MPETQEESVPGSGWESGFLLLITYIKYCCLLTPCNGLCMLDLRIHQYSYNGLFQWMAVSSMLRSA